MDTLKMQPLPQEAYGKPKMREQWRQMSYPDKIRCIVELQHRVAPIYALRNKTVTTWDISTLPSEAELKHEIERQKTLFLSQQKDTEHNFTPKHEDTESSAEAESKPPDECQAFTNNQQRINNNK